MEGKEEYEDFAQGDRVYHRNLRSWGNFIQVDEADTQTASVHFEGAGYLRVSRNQLQWQESDQ